MEENTPDPVIEVTKQKDGWKKPLTTVTPLSKYLAMALFVVLPFLGFWLGHNFTQTIDTETPHIQPQEEDGVFEEVIGTDKSLAKYYATDWIKHSYGLGRSIAEGGIFNRPTTSRSHYHTEEDEELHIYLMDEENELVGIVSTGITSGLNLNWRPVDLIYSVGIDYNTDLPPKTGVYRYLFVRFKSVDYSELSPVEYGSDSYEGYEYINNHTLVGKDYMAEERLVSAIPSDVSFKIISELPSYTETQGNTTKPADHLLTTKTKEDTASYTTKPAQEQEAVLIPFPRQQLDENSYRDMARFGYAYDSENRVYLDGTLIPGAEYDSFTYFGSCSFAEMGGNMIMRDADDAFWGTEKIENIDLNTYVEIGDYITEQGMPWGYTISKDKDDVFIACESTPELDANSIVYLEQGYLYDKSGTYYVDKLYEGADLITLQDVNVDTFEYLGKGYATDGHNVYLNGTLIEDAKPTDYEKTW